MGERKETWALAHALTHTRASPEPREPVGGQRGAAACTHLAATALGQLLVWPSIPREHLVKRDRLLLSTYSSPCHYYFEQQPV